MFCVCFKNKHKWEGDEVTCRNALTLGRVELCGTAENMRLSPGILLVFLTLVDSDSSPGKGLRRLNLPTQHRSLFLTLPKQASHLPSMPYARRSTLTVLRPEDSLLWVKETSSLKQNIFNQEGVIFHLVSFQSHRCQEGAWTRIYKPRPAATSFLPQLASWMNASSFFPHYWNEDRVYKS